MNDVDPFAGIGAGHLEGIDLDVGTDDEDPGPAYAPALPVIPGSLGGEGETSDDDELAERAEDELARINDELDASMAQALATENEQLREPDDTPDPDYTTRRAQELQLVAAPVEPTPLTRGGRRGRPTTVVKQTITYLIFGQEQLEGGEPYWYVEREVDATSYDDALYRAWLDVGKPTTGMTAHVQRKDTWEPRVLEIELVPRATRKLVVRQ